MSWLDTLFGGAGLTIASAGTSFPSRPTMNFVSGATVVDNPGSNRIDVTVLGGGSGVTSVNGLTGTPSVVAGTGMGVSAAGSSITVTNNGVTSFNTFTGAVGIVAGTNVTFSTSGGFVTINATGGGGSSPTGAGLAKVSGSAFVSAAALLAPADQGVYQYDVSGLGPGTVTAPLAAQVASVVIYKGALAGNLTINYPAISTGARQRHLDSSTGFAISHGSNPLAKSVYFEATYNTLSAAWELVGAPALSGTGSVVTTAGFPGVTTGSVGQPLVQGASGPPAFANDFGVGASNVTGTRKRFPQSVTAGGPISVSANSLGCDIVLTGTAPSNTTLTLYPGWSGKIINQAIWSTGWQTTFTNCLSYWCKVVGAVSGTVWVPPSNALPSTATNNAIGTSGNPWRLPSMVEIFDVTGTGVIVRLGDSEAFSMTFTDIGNLFNASGAIGSYGLALPAIPAGHALTFAAGVVRTAFVGGATNLSLGTQSGGTPSAVFLATSGSFVGGSVGGVYGFVLASELGTSFLSADGYITTRLTVDTTPIVFMQQTSAASTAGGMDVTISGMRLSV